MKWAELARSKGVIEPLPIIIPYFCDFMASDVSRELAQLKVPVLVIVPGFTPQLLAEVPALRVQQHDAWKNVAQISPLVQVREIAGARLFAMYDDPDVFDGMVADFMAAVMPSGPW